MHDKLRMTITGVAALGAVAAWAGISKVHWSDGSTSDRAAISFDQLKDFDAVAIESVDDVVITPGDRFAVQAKGDKAEIKQLKLYVKDGMLHVDRVRQHGSWFGLSGNADVHVTMPQLKRIRLSGTGDVRVDGVPGKDLAARLSGTGDLTLNNIAADHLTLDLSGTGDVSATGKTKDLAVTVSGSGDMSLGQLQAQTSQITLVGSGDVDARVSGATKLVVSGSGDAHVQGTNECQIVKTGSGEAECST